MFILFPFVASHRPPKSPPFPLLSCRGSVVLGAASGGLGYCQRSCELSKPRYLTFFAKYFILLIQPNNIFTIFVVQSYGVLLPAVALALWHFDKIILGKTFFAQLRQVLKMSRGPFLFCFGGWIPSQVEKRTTEKPQYKQRFVGACNLRGLPALKIH